MWWLYSARKCSESNKLCRLTQRKKELIAKRVVKQLSDLLGGIKNIFSMEKENLLFCLLLFNCSEFFSSNFLWKK